MTTKICKTCQQVKPVSAFTKIAKASDGLFYHCRPCAAVLNKKWRDVRREENTKKTREYHNTKAGYLMRSYSRAKARAKKCSFEFSLPDGYLHQLWEEQEGLCALTKHPMQHEIGCTDRRTNDFNASPDRIDNTLGYVEGNVRLVCWIVNDMKGQRTDQEFLYFAHLIYNSLTTQDGTTSNNLSPPH